LTETAPGKTRNTPTRDLVVLPALCVIVLIEFQMSIGVWRFIWPLLALSLLSRPALKVWACVLLVRVLLASVVTWSPLDWVLSPGFLVVRTAFAWIMLVQDKLLAGHRVAQTLCRKLLPYAGLVRKLLVAVAIGLVLAVVFFDVWPYAYLCLAGFLVYVTMRLPRPTRTTERGIRRGLVETGLVVASVLVCLALFELAVRLIVPPPPAARGMFFRAHPRALYCNAENAVVEHITNEFRRTYLVSDQGFRDRHYDKKEDSTYRILCLGDSSTMGTGAYLKETYAKVLERLLAEQNLNKRIEVINAGTGGYGVWQERIMLEEKGLALEPDMVILQLHPQTDVRDALARVGKVTRSYCLDWQKDVIEVWRRRRTTAPTRTLCRYSRGFAFVYRRYVQLESRLQRRLRGRFRRVVRRFPPSEDERPYWCEPSLSTYYPELEEGWELLEGSVCEIANSCRERQIAFLLFVIPALHEVCDGVLERVTDRFGIEPELYDVDKTVRLVREMCTRNGIDFVETLDRLRQLSDNRGCPYYITDGHIKAAGHAVCAEALCEYLMEAHLHDLIPYSGEPGE